MKKLTTLFSGTAAGAALSLTASLGAVAAQAAAPDTPSGTGPGTRLCVLSAASVPPCGTGVAAALAGDGQSASTQSAPMPVGVPGPWVQTFGDEFNGTTLDTNKWSTFLVRRRHE